MPKRKSKRNSKAIPAKPKVYGDPPSPPPSPKHPVVDITAPPENPELAIAMHFAETAGERSTAELLWVLPHLKGDMPRSGRQCDLVSAEIARRQQAQPAKSYQQPSPMTASGGERTFDGPVRSSVSLGIEGGRPSKSE